MKHKMADDDDLEYSDTNVGSAQTIGVRKNISIKLKGKSRGRGRKSVRGRRGSTKKSLIGSSADDDEIHTAEGTATGESLTSGKQFSDSISLDEVISKLETPSFSPMDRSFPEPLHQNKKLRWDHKVNLIGEKIINPMIHCCEKCCLPILNYGRMLPCRHVFCYECAKKAEKVCPKCDEEVEKVEQAALGTVFMCTFGGSRLGPVTCGRTYLSQRDLQAHINHRHLKHLKPAASVSESSTPTSSQASGTYLSSSQVGRDPRDPRGHMHEVHPTQNALAGHVQSLHGHAEHRDQGEHSRNPPIPPGSVPSGSTAGQQRQYPHSPASYPTIPVSSARPNLITVTIQDDNSATQGQHGHPQGHPPQYPQQSSIPPPPHPVPPMQHPSSSYPPPLPPHTYQHPVPVSAPTYSQAPLITTQTFTPHAPPPVHCPPMPPMHAPNTPMYSAPPPPVHHPPPTTYSNPPVVPPPHTSHNLPPQRFPTTGTYEESSYMQPWTSGGVRPPPPRAPLPPPRPIVAPPSSNHNLGHIPPRGPPSDPGYRPPYYQ